MDLRLREDDKKKENGELVRNRLVSSKCTYLNKLINPIK